MLLDWAKLGELGVGVVALVILYMLVRAFLQVWDKSIDAQKDSIVAQNKSTEALQKNTEAYNKLSDVFAKSNEREIEYQEKTMRLLKENQEIGMDIRLKVNDIHKKIV